jgi:hypothetical protein
MPQVSESFGNRPCEAAGPVASPGESRPDDRRAENDLVAAFFFALADTLADKRRSDDSANDAR